MSRNLSLLAVITLFGLSDIAYSGDSAAVRGAALLQEAHTIVETALYQPLTQSGLLTIHTGTKPLDGQYTYASSGSFWRDEIVIAGYEELRVRTGSEEKIQRSLGYAPLPIYAAFEAARPIKWLHLLQDERVTRVKNEKVAKLPTKCIEIQSKHGNRSVCVYDNGTLAALRSSIGWDYEYSEYTPFEKAQLPGRIRVTENDSLIVELQMNTAQALQAGADVRDDVIHPSQTLGWCTGVVGPSVADNKVHPNYPEAAKQSRKQGTVDIYGIIAADGRLTNLATVRSAGAELDRASLDAITQWTYHPAMCGTIPIASETVVSIHYTISR